MTDAGPKDPRDPMPGPEIGTVELQKDAEGRNIVIMTLHLKTPNGSGNHAYAAGKYRELSRFAGREYYFPSKAARKKRSKASSAALSPP